VGPVIKFNNSSRVLLCNGVGVSPEVFYHLHGVRKWSFGIHHPVLFIEHIQQLLSRLAALPELREVSGSEHTAHGLYRKQELALIARLLPTAFLTQPAAGHNAVQMGHVRNSVILKMELYYVYLLQSEIDQSWYIGYTNSLDKRITEHNEGKSYYTKRKIP